MANSCRFYSYFTTSSLTANLPAPFLEQVILHFPGELVLLPPGSFFLSLGDVASLTNTQSPTKTSLDLSYKALEQCCVTWKTCKFT